MRAFFFLAITLVTTLTLPACGFRPIYAENAGVRDVLESTYIITPGTPVGYAVRQALVNDFGAFNVGEDAPYVLNITLRSARGGFGLRVDDVSTRYEINVNATYSLRRASDGRVISSGSTTGRTAFDVPEDPFSELAAENSARERAATAAAENIRRDIQFDLFNRFGSVG